MADTIRIAQISDIHIGPTSNPSNGVDTRAHFRMVMEQVMALNIDLVVLSGDLALENGEPEAYEWIIEEMSRFPILYEVISGNHDNVSRLSRTFDLDSNIHNGELYFKVEFNKKLILFLDSTIGEVSSNQLKWLKAQAGKTPKEILLFVHHPIKLSGCKFMDTKYALQNMSEVQDAVYGIQNIKHIFSGHYHTEKTIKLNDRQTMYITPSTQIQISESNPEFEISSTAPGWRLIEWDGNSLSTEVFYIN